MFFVVVGPGPCSQCQKHDSFRPPSVFLFSAQGSGAGGARGSTSPGFALASKGNRWDLSLGIE